MFNLKKLFLSFGTVSAATAPIATVVACSESLSDEQQKIIDRLTSTQALNRLERLWLEKLVLDYMATDPLENQTNYFPNVKLVDGKYQLNDKNLVDEIGNINKEVFAEIPHVKTAFTWFMQEKLLQESKYLSQLQDTLDEEAEFDPEYNWKVDEDGNRVSGQVKAKANSDNFKALGFNKDYITSTWYEEVIAKASTANITIELEDEKGQDATVVLDTEDKAAQWIMKVLFEKDTLGFVNEIYKLFLSQEFFFRSRSDWDNVFGEDYRDNNNLSSGSWTPMDSSILQTHDFALVKFALEKNPFMSWDISLENNESLTYAGVGDVYKDISVKTLDAIHEFDKHIVEDGTFNATVDHENETGVEAIKNHFEHKARFNKINHYGLPSDLTTSNDDTVDVTNFMGYSGVSALPSQGSDNLLFSYTKLREANNQGYFNGYLNDNASVTNNISLYTDSKNTSLVNVKRLISLMPLFDNHSKYNVKDGDEIEYKLRNEFTFDDFNSEIPDSSLSETKPVDKNGTVWRDDKHLLAWNFFNMSSNDVWEDVLEYAINENGLDFKLGVTSKFVYDLYEGMGIKFIKYETK